MKVIKFGGTSVANAGNIRKVCDIVHEYQSAEKLIVVVSALGGTTDTLLECGRRAARADISFRELVQQIRTRHIETATALPGITAPLRTALGIRCDELASVCEGIYRLGECSGRTSDKLAGYGELMSSTIVAALLQASVDAQWLDSRNVIVTDEQYGNAAVQFEETNHNIRQAIEAASTSVIVVPGFVAATRAGTSTTLGRGGSDYTAAIFAAALDAAALEIWTDVSGMMTADPRFVTNARIIDTISYQDAMELSHFGAKVIYPPTIQPVLRKKIPVWIKNTFAPGNAGTLIDAGGGKNAGMIRGISSISQVSLLSLEGSGMVGVPGFSKRLFEALAGAGINVILITQGSSEHSICVGIHDKDASVAKQVVDAAFASEIRDEKLEPLMVEPDLSIIALVGEQMKRHTGVSGKMFDALGKNGINIRAIAQGSSERNISAVIDTRDVRKAVNVLHEAFFESSKKKVHLFIAGTGNVGSKLLKQLAQQQQYLSEKLKIDVVVAGLANSRQFVIQEEGISLKDWSCILQAGGTGGIETFAAQILQRNLRNSIFIDITASTTVAQVYPSLLRRSVSVVACNKIAASDTFEHYRELKQLAGEFNASFLFETNVGAGLPVIGTLSDLTGSGDSIHRIEAVLSGTLNFVFNHYDGSRPFADVVQQAQDEGYTEPDPRLDLSGTDVMRKILILAREAGYEMELADIANETFLPAACMKGTVADFYQSMREHESHFRCLYEAATHSGCKLKFVASFENGKAAVGLQHISPEHNLYHLYGKDNIVLFYTDRYREQPMVIKGAGAGAEVTASGVFADIVRAARN